MTNTSIYRLPSKSFIRVEGGFYSVPDYLVGHTLTVKVYAEEIVVSACMSEVCRHGRLTEDGSYPVDIFHYLDTLARKPVAVKNPVALRSKKRLKEVFDEHYADRPREFIASGRNAVLISNPGRGKTHLAIGFGIAARLGDMRVLFTNVPNLVIELKEAMSRNQVTAYKRRFMEYGLVIIDELGYVSFDRQGNEILFDLLSNRNDAGSMIITTNLAFERWEEVFHDTNLTGALVDRLTHRAHILDMSGESYRLKETKQLMGR